MKELKMGVDKGLAVRWVMRLMHSYKRPCFDPVEKHSATTHQARLYGDCLEIYWLSLSFLRAD
eukprot:4537985-Amphidinium_carterae.1